MAEDLTRILSALLAPKWLPPTGGVGISIVRPEKHKATTSSSASLTINPPNTYGPAGSARYGECKLG